MFAEWIRDEVSGMTTDFDKHDLHWIQELSNADLEEAFGDNAHSAFWDEFRIAVHETATELLFERDNA